MGKAYGEYVKMKISACIVARDEENYFFEACLNKLEEFCNEILIAVDTRTKDKTKQLISKFTKTKIFDFEWIDPSSYTDAKQFITEKAKGDYILHIDADEVFTDDWNIVLKVIEENPNIECFSLVSEHFIGNLCSRDATFNPHIHMYRLHKNIKKIVFPKGKMHGLPINWKGHLIIGSQRFPIIYHYGYCKNLLDIKKRYDQNIEKLEMHTPEYLSWWNNSHMLGHYPIQNFDFRKHPKEMLRLLK